MWYTIRCLSFIHLFKHGIQRFQEGNYAEGVAIFALARESLIPDHMRLNTALDRFIQTYMKYSQAQEDLLKACKLFAQADAEKQIQIAALESLLPTLEGEIEMPDRIVWNGVQRENAQLSLTLAWELFCSVPFHNNRYGTSWTR